MKVLMDDYLGRPQNREPLRRQLVALQRFLPGDVDWLGLFDSRREPELVAELLHQYYDPLYSQTATAQTCEVRFDTADPTAAAKAVIDWVEAREKRANRSVDRGLGQVEFPLQAGFPPRQTG
ncbi:MAG: hypothetical protein R3E96_13175 [Planctomycetota bacterium]